MFGFDLLADDDYMDQDSKLYDTTNESPNFKYELRSTNEHDGTDFIFYIKTPHHLWKTTYFFANRIDELIDGNGPTCVTPKGIFHIIVDIAKFEIEE